MENCFEEYVTATLAYQISVKERKEAVKGCQKAIEAAICKRMDWDPKDVLFQPVGINILTDKMTIRCHWRQDFMGYYVFTIAVGIDSKSAKISLDFREEC